MTTGFFSWRWAPAIAIVGAATILSIAAIVFIPRSIGVTAATPSRVPAVTERSDGAPRARENEPELGVTIPEGSRRVSRASQSTSVAGVESFFPGVEVTELPPPLPDDPVPPEPVDTAVNRDAIGPGVEPASMPPP